MLRGRAYKNWLH